MMSTPTLDTNAKRLYQFIKWDIVASVSGNVFIGYLALYFESIWIFVIFLASLANSITLFFAIRLVKRHKITQAVFAICTILWLLLIVVIYILPTIFSGLALLAIWPMTISISYLSRSNLRILMLISSAVGILLVFLSIRSDTLIMMDVIPPWLLQAAIVGCASAFTVLTLYQLWQYSGRLNDTLDQMKITNEILLESEQNLEMKVSLRTQALEDKNQVLADTLQQLRNTQSQLIVQEKLASLGSLTAGIAHEIQNPLNFVNNLSQLNVELINELNDIDQDISGADIAPILNDLTQISQRINDHGQRATRIVQNMLQHSRSETGTSEYVNINHLLDEYVNLAYHGIRANHRGFNLEIHKTLDHKLKPLNVVPQDIGRVFLNISTNACQALISKTSQTQDKFTPKLWLKTVEHDDTVEISIRDNGIGISPSVQESIFNPFFTTKPAGEGTGLGLSISYDIIVQGHQGQITVQSKEGQYTEFSITLPRTNAGNTLSASLADGLSAE